jgi:hypothetical protein
MSDLPRDPVDDGEGDDLELDQTEDLDTELEDEAEPGTEPEEEVEDEPEPEQPRRTRGPRGRANGEQIRELRTQLEQTQRRLDEMSRPQPQRVDPAAQQAAEERFWASVEMMPQREALQAVYARARQEMGQQLGVQQVTTQERFDQQQYDAAARTSRVHQQYRQKVDALVAAERSRGNIVGREVALKFLLGEDAINRANRIVPSQRRAATGRVDRQTTRPTNGRGDVARGGGRRDQATDDERMLRNVTVGDI